MSQANRVLIKKIQLPLKRVVGFHLYSQKEKPISFSFWCFLTILNQPVFTSPAATPLIVSSTSVTNSSGGFSVSLNSWIKWTCKKLSGSTYGFLKCTDSFIFGV